MQMAKDDAILAGLAWAIEGNLDFSPQERYGGAQLMRGVVCESANAEKSSIDALQHLVQGSRKIRDFVLGVRHRQAQVEISIIDAARFGGKGGHGREGLAAHRMSAERGQPN